MVDPWDNPAAGATTAGEFVSAGRRLATILLAHPIHASLDWSVAGALWCSGTCRIVG